MNVSRVHNEDGGYIEKMDVVEDGESYTIIEEYDLSHKMVKRDDGLGGISSMRYKREETARGVNFVEYKTCKFKNGYSESTNIISLRNEKLDSIAFNRRVYNLDGEKIGGNTSLTTYTLNGMGSVVGVKVEHFDVDGKPTMHELENREITYDDANRITKIVTTTEIIKK